MKKCSFIVFFMLLSLLISGCSKSNTTDKLSSGTYLTGTWCTSVKLITDDNDEIIEMRKAYIYVENDRIDIVIHHNPMSSREDSYLEVIWSGTVEKKIKTKQQYAKTVSKRLKNENFDGPLSDLDSITITYAGCNGFTINEGDVSYLFEWEVYD